MRQLEQCRQCDAEYGIGGSVPHAQVRAEVGDVEALERRIGDLVGALRSALPPEYFRLVWELKDAEEKVGIAERAVRDRCLVEALVRHVPERGSSIRSAADHLIGDESRGRLEYN